MDIEDLSNLKSYVPLLEKMKQRLRDASKRQGEVPKKRKSRANAIQDYVSQYDRTHYQLLISFVESPYLPSTAPLSELQKILFKEMRLETHHRGFYVLAKVITRPDRKTAIMALIEDEADEVLLLHLHQQHNEHVRPTEDVIREHSVCIIKEPYFKSIGHGNDVLSVDHVSDLLWLTEDDERIPLQWRPRISQLDKSAVEWKEEGNEAITNGKIQEAIEKYASGLKRICTTSQAQTLKLNRACAYLQLRHYDAALEDANCCLDTEKGLFGAAQAFYGLRQFHKCYDTLTLLLEKYPANQAGKNELSRTNARLKEQEHGRFDFNPMHVAAVKSKSPNLDHATYMRPVAIQETSDGRGRGLFTTRAVKAGELLLCEKAFAYSYADINDADTRSKISVLMNTYTNRIVMGTQDDLIKEIAQHLLRTPSLAPAFISLHHGDYEALAPLSVDGMPIIDTFLIDRIISLNAIGCPKTTPKLHQKKDSPSTSHNSTRHKSCGIWILASHLNHSCTSTARCSFIGDMLLLRATRDLSANTELTHWYHAPSPTNAAERKEKFLQTWVFECKCALCIYEQATPKRMLGKRAALLQDLAAAFEVTDGVDSAKAERLLAAIEKTYRCPAAEVPRLDLWETYLALARLHAERKQHAKVVVALLKLLGSLGYVIEGAEATGAGAVDTMPARVQRWGLGVDCAVEVWVRLREAYGVLRPELGSWAEECARICWRVGVGVEGGVEEVWGRGNE